MQLHPILPIFLSQLPFVLLFIGSMYQRVKCYAFLFDGIKDTMVHSMYACKIFLNLIKTLVIV